MILERHGEEAAERLCAAFGGRDLVVPHDPDQGRHIADACGLEVLATLIAERSGQSVSVPLGATSKKRQAQIELERLVREGVQAGEIIRRLRVSRHAVSAARKRLATRA